MQEEVTGKSVALIIDGAKMSEQVLEKALQKFLEAQKNKAPKMHRGKQTLKQLAGQNAGLANIEISDRNIKAFTHVARVRDMQAVLCPPQSTASAQRSASWKNINQSKQLPE